MLHHPINVLVVAAEEQSSRAVEKLLHGVDTHGFYLQRVIGLDAGFRALEEGGCDVCLLEMTSYLAAQIGAEASGPQSTPTAMINRFVHHIESHVPPIPLLVLTDDAALDCDPDRVLESLQCSPIQRLDRSRTTPYGLERAICFAMERCRLITTINDLQSHDELSGLLSRPALEFSLERELNRSHRYRYPLAVLAVRIDKYSGLVEEYGDEVGDQVQRWIGMVIQENIRSVDFAGRLSAGYFVLILPETHARAAVTVAQRLQMRVAGRPFVLFPEHGSVIELDIMISSGISEASRESESSQSVLGMADRAVREAQRQLRTRILVYSDVWPE
jgi:diguanylate cyclase (GGDEF)-like protein